MSLGNDIGTLSRQLLRNIREDQFARLPDSWSRAEKAAYVKEMEAKNG